MNIIQTTEIKLIEILSPTSFLKNSSPKAIGAMIPVIAQQDAMKLIVRIVRSLPLTISYRDVGDTSSVSIVPRSFSPAQRSNAV